MSYTVTTYYKDGETQKDEFASIKEARTFAIEECKWENTEKAVITHPNGETTTYEGTF